jgi:hypothetical protein
LATIPGALYVDGTSGAFKQDELVLPGQRYTYIWELPANFANTPDDDPCIPWAYHSHTFPEPDVDTGLVGMLLTCKKGRYGVINRVLTFKKGTGRL